jgi:hypothetical protein
MPEPSNPQAGLNCWAAHTRGDVVGLAVQRSMMEKHACWSEEAYRIAGPRQGPGAWRITAPFPLGGCAER